MKYIIREKENTVNREFSTTKAFVYAVTNDLSAFQVLTNNISMKSDLTITSMNDVYIAFKLGTKIMNIYVFETEYVDGAVNTYNILQTIELLHKIVDEVVYASVIVNPNGTTVNFTKNQDCIAHIRSLLCLQLNVAKILGFLDFYKDTKNCLNVVDNHLEITIETTEGGYTMNVYTYNAHKMWVAIREVINKLIKGIE